MFLEVAQFYKHNEFNKLKVYIRIKKWEIVLR